MIYRTLYKTMLLLLLWSTFALVTSDISHLQGQEEYDSDQPHAHTAGRYSGRADRQHTEVNDGSELIEEDRLFYVDPRQETRYLGDKLHSDFQPIREDAHQHHPKDFQMQYYQYNTIEEDHQRRHPRSDGNMMSSGTIVEPGAVIGPGAILDPGAILRSGAVTGPGSRVGSGAEIMQGAVVGPHAYAMANSKMNQGSVMGPDAVLGVGAVMGAGSVMGPNSVMGPGAVLAPREVLAPGEHRN